ncbi:MAG TPA: 50S ribosomal protein L29 [Candidatus Binatia bacterium]|nr:50S ribosomal protein L29 [Candidatus Binatia bacterium]
MKSADYLKQLRGKKPEELHDELAALQKEQFNLRFQAAAGQQPKSHLAGEVKKRIARLKTLLTQQAKS